MTTLEKIRAEINGIEINGQVDEHTMFIRTGEHVKQMALDIIDKYAEQEPMPLPKPYDPNEDNSN